MSKPNRDIVSLEPKELWEKVFTVNPLVVIGSTEPDGSPNFAPKHMAFALGWDAYFGFVCTPDHSTYQNIKRSESFSVTYPKPDQIVLSSLTASPRQADDTKPELELLDRFAAVRIPEYFLTNGYLYLECRMEQIIDNFGQNSLILGKVIEAHADEAYVRDPSRDDNELVFKNPLLCYLYPGRFSVIDKTNAFPFPENFQK